jgi:hypothetical protein
MTTLLSPTLVVVHLTQTVQPAAADDAIGTISITNSPGDLLMLLKSGTDNTHVRQFCARPNTPVDHARPITSCQSNQRATQMRQ